MLLNTNYFKSNVFSFDTKKITSPFYAFLFLSIFLCSFTSHSQKIKVNGIILDETNTPIPFAAVGITNKNIGTSSTQDGEFSLLLTNNHLQDILSFSCLGYNTFKIKVQDYLNQKDKKIVLAESVFEMSEITLIKPSHYVFSAVKKLKENTISKYHKKELLYRRAATEGGRSKFFVENYIKIKDRGPAYFLGTVRVTEARKSADYRIWKSKQWTHSITHMANGNPLRPSDKKPNLKKYTWKIIGDSSYEGEEVVIVEGTNKKRKWDKIKFYIGVDTYGVYRIERNKALYIYKKHKSGKLYLSYFSNEWGFNRDMIPKEYWNTEAEKMSYRLEAFVLNIQAGMKSVRLTSFGDETDMGSQELPYNPTFWKNLSMPPDTKFYKKIKSELQSNYGVSLEKQFELVNN